MKSQLLIRTGNWLAIMLIWKAAVMPDGRVAATINPSIAHEAGLQVNDVVLIVNGHTYRHEPWLEVDPRVIVVRRGEKLIPIMNPRLKDR